MHYVKPAVVLARRRLVAAAQQRTHGRIGDLFQRIAQSKRRVNEMHSKYTDCSLSASSTRPCTTIGSSTDNGLLLQMLANKGLGSRVTHIDCQADHPTLIQKHLRKADLQESAHFIRVRRGLSVRFHSPLPRIFACLRCRA
jgi:hypothetical protein